MTSIIEAVRAFPLGERRSGPACLALYRRGGDRIYVHGLLTPPDERRRGHAGRLLDALTAEADAAGVDLYLEVTPFEVAWDPEDLRCLTTGMSREALEGFYGRRGFVLLGGNVMLRKAS